MKIVATQGKELGLDKFTWYYKFIMDNGEDFTSNMKWLGGRIYKDGIRSTYNPRQLQEVFRGVIRIGKDFDLGGDLANAQREIDKCNKKSGCEAYGCTNRDQSLCKILANYNNKREAAYIKQRFVGLSLESFEIRQKN